MTRPMLMVILLIIILVALSPQSQAAEVKRVPLPEIFFIASDSFDPQPAFSEGMQKLSRTHVIFFFSPPLPAFTQHGPRPAFVFLAFPRLP